MKNVFEAILECGHDEDFVPAETQEELRQALPQVEIVTMPGLGHYPSDEKPEEFLAIVAAAG